ncbi:DUF3784 domain-containing protein [Clostridium sp. MCC353]|uniref:DUF3784 domain-containing protein n=1 Tax=Clostridium sp. MCC353 TaxID=2592646 RepID=UPI001C026324|nr:DUF3784 domain-containing protein [Clostridium sp. MCC353]MBT9778006.1 DUF3784 domain-containing protein [Clostridium sp. MCC353]
MGENEIWAAVCVSLAAVFCLLGIVFALSGEKGAMLVSGFNTLSKEEREKYDRKQISLDMRNSLFLWSGILGAGAVCSIIFHWGMAAAALLIWLVLFFRDVHLDAHKAFEKYKK